MMMPAVAASRVKSVRRKIVLVMIVYLLSMLALVMLHTADGDIGYQSYRIIIISQRDIHILLGNYMKI